MADKAFPQHTDARGLPTLLMGFCWILRFGTDVCVIWLSGACCLLSGAAHPWWGDHTWGSPVLRVDSGHTLATVATWLGLMSIMAEPRKHLVSRLPRAPDVNASDGRWPVLSGGVWSRLSGSQNQLPR